MGVSLLARGAGHVVMFGWLSCWWLPPAGVGVGFWEKFLWVQGTETLPANSSQ